MSFGLENCSCKEKTAMKSLVKVLQKLCSQYFEGSEQHPAGDPSPSCVTDVELVLGAIQRLLWTQAGFLDSSIKDAIRPLFIIMGSPNESLKFMSGTVIRDMISKKAFDKSSDKSESTNRTLVFAQQYMDFMVKSIDKFGLAPKYKLMTNCLLSCMVCIVQLGDATEISKRLVRVFPTSGVLAN